MKKVASQFGDYMDICSLSEISLTLGFNSVAKSDTPVLPSFRDIAETWLSGGTLNFL